MTDFIHSTACIDEGAVVGDGTRIWHFSHIASGARIGRNCSLGQNVYVADGVTVGNGVKIQNNVSLYSGVHLEDDVFCGPSCVFTNVINPRSQVSRKAEFQETRVRRGATIGANATIVCGVTVDRYGFVGAGSVVTKDVPQYALVIGVPGVQIGWMTRHGQRLAMELDATDFVCPQSDWRYEIDESGQLNCKDWPEDVALPAT
jgi:UDP-2-acetamido-3-amino-2,3-dideoxy-glucuronate N-acetyltransferase